LEHLDVAINLSDLAHLYFMRGKYAEAAILFKQSFAIGEKVLGPERAELAGWLKDYAAVLHKVDRSAEATALEDRAEAIRAKCIIE
jgi:hypothetical protein